MTKLNVLIFGISGQDGFYLKEICENHGYNVVGISRSSGSWIRGDVSDLQQTESLIKEYTPRFVFHLAAISSTSHNFLFDNHQTISTGSINILESVYRYSPGTRVFLSGSALQFTNDGEPVTEDNPFEASSSYALSRIHSVYAARYYRQLGVRAYIGYFFHHDSPRRPEKHINMKIAKAAHRIKEGSKEILEIGNLEVVKEYNYAGDLMEAIWMMTNQENYYEAVVGSGRGYAISDWINICFEIVGKDWKDYVRVKEGFIPEFQSLVSNPQVLFSLGWKPKIDIYELAHSMIHSKLSL